MSQPELQDYIRRAFISDRRNLLLTSVALFLVQYSGIVFKKISFFGNEAEINDPYMILILLWIFWFYFALRYYQHFREIPDKGISNIYDQILHNSVAMLARKRYQDAFVPSSNFQGMEREFRFESIQPTFHGRAHVEVKLPATVLYKLPTGGQGEERKTEFIVLRWKDMFFPNLRSLLHVVINTSLATEYLLPIGVALLPLGFGLIKLLRAIWR